MEPKIIHTKAYRLVFYAIFASTVQNEQEKNRNITKHEWKAYVKHKISLIIILITDTYERTGFKIFLKYIFLTFFSVFQTQSLR